MAGAPADAEYRSAIPYESSRINAAAVYCSDGRLGDHIDDFLHAGLGLPRYDRLACPGGPVALAGRLLAFWEARGVDDQLRFLIHAHEVRQVVLIAHAGCAYYGERFGLAGEAAAAEQREDLVKARAAVQRIDREIEVAGYFAHLEADGIRFELVFAEPGLVPRVSRVHATDVAPPPRPPSVVRDARPARR